MIFEIVTVCFYFYRLIFGRLETAAICIQSPYCDKKENIMHVEHTLLLLGVGTDDNHLSFPQCCCPATVSLSCFLNAEFVFALLPLLPGLLTRYQDPNPTRLSDVCTSTFSPRNIPWTASIGRACPGTTSMDPSSEKRLSLAPTSSTCSIPRLVNYLQTNLRRTGSRLPSWPYMSVLCDCANSFSIAFV